MKNRTLALEMLKLTRPTFSGKRSVRALQKCNGMNSVKTTIWRISILLSPLRTMHSQASTKIFRTESRMY